MASRFSGEALPAGARVLPAHLESNFINPDYNGAQPLTCLRTPAPPLPQPPEVRSFPARIFSTSSSDMPPDVGIVTLAPEIEGGLALVRRLAQLGVRVSLGTHRLHRSMKARRRSPKARVTRRICSIACRR
jgi:N-acetylglucosamine-6-phosphate deacetylase